MCDFWFGIQNWRNYFWNSLLSMLSLCTKIIFKTQLELNCRLKKMYLWKSSMLSSQCVLLGQNRGVSYSAKRCDDNTEIFHYCRWALLRSASKFLCSLCDGISHCCKYIFHTKYLCWNISDLSICPFIHIYSIKNNFIVILIVLFLSECDF